MLSYLLASDKPHLAIAVAVMPTPLALPAMSEVTELLMSREEPAKQELPATRSGNDTATRHTHSHNFLPHTQQQLLLGIDTDCSNVSVQKVTRD